MEPDGRAIRFTLPPIEMFIPSQNTEWNLSKGPSDTLTKLFDDSEESITIRSPQTVAVGRFLSVLAAAFHQCLQTTQAKKETDRKDDNTTLIVTCCRLPVAHVQFTHKAMHFNRNPRKNLSSCRMAAPLCREAGAKSLEQSKQ